MICSLRENVKRFHIFIRKTCLGPHALAAAKRHPCGPGLGFCRVRPVLCGQRTSYTWDLFLYNVQDVARFCGMMGYSENLIQRPDETVNRCSWQNGPLVGCRFADEPRGKPIRGASLWERVPNWGRKITEALCSTEHGKHQASSSSADAQEGLTGSRQKRSHPSGRFP